ncbi:MAG TPA: hypothetical protein VFJ82_11610, partial [Longimicrobium sp.]|nr:hypothetical protein [Longimicrobium sp.]
ADFERVVFYPVIFDARAMHAVISTVETAKGLLVVPVPIDERSSARYTSTSSIRTDAYRSFLASILGGALRGLSSGLMNEDVSIARLVQAYEIDECLLYSSSSRAFAEFGIALESINLREKYLVSSEIRDDCDLKKVTLAHRSGKSGERGPSIRLIRAKASFPLVELCVRKREDSPEKSELANAWESVRGGIAVILG